MAPIWTIFGPNESQRCQLNFEKNLGRRKNFREGEKFEKVSRKVRKILARTRFLGRNKIETFILNSIRTRSNRRRREEADYENLRVILEECSRDDSPVAVSFQILSHNSGRNLSTFLQQNKGRVGWFVCPQ